VKLHDLRPAAGSRRARTRVGRGIAAGKGKTAGRGTKGQRARTGASIPSWFEGGQTPIHIRVPKLRGFTNRFKIEYAVVNVGQISAYAAAGRFGVAAEPAPRAARGKQAEQPVPTINAEALAAAGLVRSSEMPVKVLGQGEVSQKLFVAADAFSASARRKIEEAGGFVQVLAPARPASETVVGGEPGAEMTPEPETAPAAEAEVESTSRPAPVAEAKDEAGPAPAAKSRTRAAPDTGPAPEPQPPKRARKRAAKSPESA
jgi:large subunit ribosomal protein L15